MSEEVSAETIRRRVVVGGRVQGVFFRDTARRIATGKGLAGSATNLRDGSVEIVVEGDPEAVAEMIEWCRRGPQWSEVSGIEVTEEEPQGLSGFSIG